jgi:hypothetical protein
VSELRIWKLREKALVESLEGRDDGDRSDKEDENSGAKLVKAEVEHRGVLDDETAKEQKEHWKGLLEE